MQPMESLLGVHFAGVELLTGLPEYRNGGLFVDTGVLTLKPEESERGLQNYSDYCRRTGVKAVEVAPMFEPSDDVIVEWRGVTVGFLDRLLVETNRFLTKDLNGGELTLAQLLEAGSWKVSRCRHRQTCFVVLTMCRAAVRLPRSADQTRRNLLSLSTAMGRCFEWGKLGFVGGSFG